MAACLLLELCSTKLFKPAADYYSSSQERGGGDLGVRKYLVVAVFVISCLVLTRLAVVTFSFGGIVYNPWYDINDDGKIDVKDVYKVSQAYGTNGVPLVKASVQYDSGWIDITGKCGQNITVMHGLGITDWNNESIDVGIMGKTNPDGGLLRYVGLTGRMGWSRTCGRTHTDYAYALVQTVDGGYTLAGTTYSLGAGNGDVWLVKTDAAGNELWNKTYGGTNTEEAWALVRTVDGGYALAGMTGSFGAGNGDAWLVKTDVESGLAWVDSTANTITLHRGATDAFWNFVRVRVWEPRQTP